MDVGSNTNTNTHSYIHIFPLFTHKSTPPTQTHTHFVIISEDETQGAISPEIIYILLLLLLRSNPCRQHSKVLCRWGVSRRGKTGKHRKRRVKRKWGVLAQPPYSPQGNGRQVPRVEPFKQGHRPPDVEENPGSQYRQKLEGQARPRAHSRYIYVKQE